MSKVDKLLMGCIYLILGIPLIYMSKQTPEVEDISHLKVNEDSINTFLNYPQNSVIAADIGWFQKILCVYGLHPSPVNSGTPIPQNPRCKDIKNNSQKLDWADNAFRLNRLKMACFTIGIILCVLSFFNFIQLLTPKPISLKQKMKNFKKSKKKKK